MVSRVGSKVSSLIQKEPVVVPLLVLLAIVWLLPHTPLLSYVDQQIQHQYNQLPSVRVDLHPYRSWQNRYSTNRTVLYIETRDEIKYATPLLLHMIQVVPPEWRFLFISTASMLESVNKSGPIQRMVETGKLRLQDVQAFSSGWEPFLSVEEAHSRLLTDVSFYDGQLPGVEHLLIFRSNSIMCAGSAKTVNDYLQYDWVGAPWKLNDRYGGNGGLSLRKISKVREILSFQSRPDDTESEDEWFSRRIGLLPKANNADAAVAATFSVEDIWEDEPLGYHIPPDLDIDGSVNVWNSLEKRRKIFAYCPEVKIILPMRLNKESCNVNR